MLLGANSLRLMCRGRLRQLCAYPTTAPACRTTQLSRPFTLSAIYCRRRRSQIAANFTGIIPLKRPLLFTGAKASTTTRQLRATAANPTSAIIR